MEQYHFSASSAQRTTAVALAIFGCSAALITHIIALYGSNLDAVTTPVGALANTEDAALFRYGLWLFALGHLALVPLLHYPKAKRFTQGAQFLVLLNTILIFCLPWHFASLSPAELMLASYPLWLLGSSVGFAMFFVSVALWRRHRSGAIATLVCLMLWSALVPVFFAIDPSWIGAYQRAVGAILLAWTFLLAVSLRMFKPSIQAH